MTNKLLTLGVVAAVLIGTGLSATPAYAQYEVTLTQEGSNIVAKGSGSIDTTGLTFLHSVDAVPPSVVARAGQITTGGTGESSPASYYSVPLTSGTPIFGDGVADFSDANSGDLVGFDGMNLQLAVPVNYASGSPLTSMSTYDDEDFGSLGVTRGIYKWTWGSGATAGSFTLVAGVAAPGAPEPATLGLMVLGLLGAGFAGRKRRH